MEFLRMYLVLTIFFIPLLPVTTFAQKEILRTKIEQIIKEAKGNVGVAIMEVESKDTLTINGNNKFPMQSVFKFPLALAILSHVDKGKLSLNKKIHVKKDDLVPNTWSPMAKKYPEGNVNLTLDEILRFTASLSDNNGCDILFGLIGGPAKVKKYIHHLGVTDIAITSTEAEMHKDWEVQFSNWCTPVAMSQLLYKFYQGEILSKKSTEYLWGLLVNGGTGSKKIKGLLPSGTVVAHKSGLSGTNEAGIVGASNDVGIINLPNKKHLIVVVFISNSLAGEDKCDEVIAEITKAAWDWSLNN